MSCLEASEVTYHASEKVIIQNISLQTQKGKFVGLLGPNGSGKSTFLKTVYRVLSPQHGKIILDGQLTEKYRTNELFQKLSVVGQEAHGDFDFSAIEVVMMGRYPFKTGLQTENQEDQQIVENALHQVNMWDRREQVFLSLSGGEKQRILIARALAQTPQYLILDEPTNHLDIYHQIEILDLLKQLDTGILTTLHDLNLAAYYCDYLYLLKEGNVVAEGTPEKVLTQENIVSIYEVDVDIQTHPQTNKLHIMFLPHRV